MQNCWEFIKCERQPGGAKVGELGVCPLVTDASSDGTNSGKNGGRFCWSLTGTFCGEKVQGTNAMKLTSCMKCDFFRVVMAEARAAGKFVLAK